MCALNTGFILATAAEKLYLKNKYEPKTKEKLKNREAIAKNSRINPIKKLSEEMENFGDIRKPPGLYSGVLFK